MGSDALKTVDGPWPRLQNAELDAMNIKVDFIRDVLWNRAGILK